MMGVESDDRAEYSPPRSMASVSMASGMGGVRCVAEFVRNTLCGSVRNT